MTIHIFYHSADLDGHCSGAIARDAIAGLQYREGMLLSSVVMHQIDYGWPFPWEAIGHDDEVFMLDFCLQPFEQMLALQSACRKFTWIDHHVEAIEAARAIGFEAHGLQKVGTAACELCWEYFHACSPMPRGVRLLGRYDVWDKSDPETDGFQWHMRNHDETRPDKAPGLWDAVLCTHGESGAQLVSCWAKHGDELLRFQKREYAKLCRAFAFEATMSGLRIVAVNAGLINSMAFASVWDPERHDAMCAFVRTKRGTWKVSLYTDKPEVNVGEICTRKGGGGHRNAAGFECDALPFADVCPLVRSVG